MINEKLGNLNGVETNRDKQSEQVLEFLKNADIDKILNNSDAKFQDFENLLIQLNGIIRNIPVNERDIDGKTVVITDEKGLFAEDVPPDINDKEKLLEKMFNSGKNINDRQNKALLFSTIINAVHPFDDGNGRIARTISDMLLAKSEKSTQRFYSMSSQIQKERSTYYHILEKCQKGTLEITLWVEWFLGCLKRAIEDSEKTLETILTKALFWENHAGESFNDRQFSMVNRLLNGFEGKLTSSKWAKIEKCSQDTALRDINNLVEHKILTKERGGGRSTSYALITGL